MERGGKRERVQTGQTRQEIKQYYKRRLNVLEKGEDKICDLVSYRREVEVIEGSLLL